ALQAAVKQDYRLFFAQEFDRRKKALYPPFTLMVRFLCDSKTMEDAWETAEAIKKEIEVRFSDTPLWRRVLYIRADEAPINRIQDRCRAQVLMKLLNHPDTDQMLETFQDMARMDRKAHTVLEINPSSLA
ncbi:MAG: hypothetical protein IJ968_04025, partial [Clostridia bacterium]|nr:hypothetical protein [Clostridia bacterium]